QNLAPAQGISGARQDTARSHLTLIK
ncbi:MAG: hypothetical protein RL020_611, partial [Pseudomonadota bacterium]